LQLLDVQARDAWDRAGIARGLASLDRSARGAHESRYHLEASIAACHAVAPTFEDTDWDRIERLYQSLQTLTDSPVVALNRAVALAMTRGPEAALEFLDALTHDDVLRHYLPFHATVGELRRRSGDPVAAGHAFRRALTLPASEPERAFLTRKLVLCEAEASALS
jgi:RNA polymerase sigma-70 factor (ECF subfamily)